MKIIAFCGLTTPFLVRSHEPEPVSTRLDDGHILSDEIIQADLL